MMNIIVIGDSGHSKVITDMIHLNNNMELLAKLDDKYTDVFNECGIVKGPVENVSYLLKVYPNSKVVIAIGDNRVRQLVSSKLGLDEDNYISIVHPSAIVSPTAKIGVGTVVMANAVINADANVGRHTIINTGSIVEHDSIVDDYAHISPMAVMTGGVKVGVGVHIGAGASVIPNKRIGDWAIVGAGSVVTDNINEGATVVGAPARENKKEGF